MPTISPMKTAWLPLSTRAVTSQDSATTAFQQGQAARIGVPCPGRELVAAGDPARLGKAQRQRAVGLGKQVDVEPPARVDRSTGAGGAVDADQNAGRIGRHRTDRRRRDPARPVLGQGGDDRHRPRKTRHRRAEPGGIHRQIGTQARAHLRLPPSARTDSLPRRPCGRRTQGRNPAGRQKPLAIRCASRGSTQAVPMMSSTARAVAVAASCWSSAPPNPHSPRTGQRCPA